MIPGRVFAASPKSTSQISPGWGFIEQVENFLFGRAGLRDIQGVVIGEIHDLDNALSGLCCHLRFPLAQPGL